MNCIQKANAAFLKDIRAVIPSRGFIVGTFQIVTTVATIILAIILFSWVITDVLPIQTTPLFWWLSVFFGLGVSLLLGIYYIMCLLDNCIPDSLLGGDE